MALAKKKGERKNVGEVFLVEHNSCGTAVQPTVFDAQSILPHTGNKGINRCYETKIEEEKVETINLNSTKTRRPISKTEILSMYMRCHFLELLW